jgi:hypothetical protein
MEHKLWRKMLGSGDFMDEMDVTPTPDPHSPAGVYIPRDLQGCFWELNHMLLLGIRHNVRACEESSLTQHHLGLGMWMGGWKVRLQSSTSTARGSTMRMMPPARS